MFKLKTNGTFTPTAEGGLLHLNEPYAEEKEKEAQLFFPKSEAVLRVNGKPFTHLKLGVPIEVQDHLLTIDLIEGEGDFSLHLVMGPPMEGDQWILCLKALRRSDHVTLRFTWVPLSSSS